MSLYLMLGAAALFAALSLFGTVEHHRANAEAANYKIAEDGRKAAVTQLRVATTERDGLRGSLTTCNTSVDRLGKASADATARAASAAQAAAAAGAGLRQAAVDILKQPPSVPNDACKSLEALFNAYFRGKP